MRGFRGAGADSRELRGDEGVGALEPLPVQADSEPAVLLLLEQLVGAVVPDLDRAGAVLSRGDLSLERRILERMVLDVDGEVLLSGLEGHAFGNRPARERAVSLQTEVVMEAASVVPLDDEDRRLSALLAAERLRRLLGVALALVLGELRLCHAA